MTTDRVPSKDYTKQYAALGSDLIEELRRVLLEENPILGESVAAFEREFATHVGTTDAVGVGSGTDALILALRSLEVGPGDQVITAANTFAATVTAILSVGARPVLVEPDPSTWTLDVGGTRAALGPKTAAVLPVHLYGRLCAMPQLLELCETRGVPIVEDAAQSHGAAYGGRRAGSFGAFGCFSFHPSKNLGAFGDGGAITCNSKDAPLLRELRNLGKRGKHEFVHVATNSKLDTLQAAILRVKLRHLDAANARRRDHARRYAHALTGVGDLDLPALPVSEEHVFHLFAVHTESRDALRAHLAARGIRAGLHYPTPPHLQPMVQHLGYRKGEFPIAEASARHQLSLPIAAELGPEQIDFTCDAIRDFYDEGPRLA